MLKETVDGDFTTTQVVALTVVSLIDALTGQFLVSHVGFTQ